MRKKLLIKYLKLINYWPPFFGSGIRIKEINEDRTKFVIKLKLNSRNKNLFGTQFGGSLYAMCDPFYVFILIINLGNDFIVWDKTAQIEFVKPGKSKVFATIEIPQSEIQKIKAEVIEIGKSTYFFTTSVKDEDGTIIAKVKKEIYVRHKLWEQPEQKITT